MEYKYLNYYNESFEIVKGEPLRINEIPEIDFYMTKRGSQWQVCIKETGEHFKPFRSKRKAIDEAINTISHWGKHRFINNMMETREKTKSFKVVQEVI